ncbi:MAG: cadherin repeat domain-containing protein [Bdellovibrio sp.]|nr:cadherin repeat domain-containing protein [Bdellovibrio sp.]
MRVFQDSPTDVLGLGTFVTELSFNAGILYIPSTLTKGDYGNRTNASVPQPLDLIVKAYVEDHPSGDFIFEAPLLGPSVSVTNVTTALFWLLKWGFTNPYLQVSQNAFSSMATSVELICQSCRTKTNSQVLAFIQSRTDLIDKIKQTLINENPSLNINYSWNPDPIRYAWSTPVLTTHGLGSKTAKQLETIKSDVIAVSPMNSTVKVRAASWLMTRADQTTVAVTGSPLIYTFTNEDQVSSDFVPTFAESAAFGAAIKIHFEVGRANRAPVCDEPIKLTMKANRLNTTYLTDFCYDPDNPTATPNLGVTYALVSGPSGMTISSSGVLKWSPVNSLAGQVYDFQVLVTSSTSANHIATGKVKVKAVTLPNFIDVISGTFTEGSISQMDININDPEGDPLVLSIAGITSVKNGFPSGAGVLSTITSVGTDPTLPIFNWSFMPSYLQVIGADGPMQLRFTLRYNTSVDPTLDGSQILATQDATFDIINTDDPPVWDSQPQEADLIEGTVFSLPMGSAHDPQPNPTALTYSLQSADGRCDWSSTTSFSVDGSTGAVTLNGSPDYNSWDQCSFQVISKDANGLTSSSETFTYNVANTNRPITEITPSTVSSISGTENKILMIPVEEMFTDEDLTINDPRERITWTCYVNTTGAGDPFTDLCSTKKIYFSLSTTSFSGSWFPQYGTAGDYYIKLQGTDVGGASASHIFQMHIEAAPAPMLATIQQDGIDTTSIVTNENMSSTVVLHVTPQSDAAVNQYTYNVSTPTCYIKSGTGTCRAAMISVPSSLEGVGAQDFTFLITPNYTDGDSAYPLSSRDYIVSFTITKADDPEVITQVSASLTVNNTDRNPSAIGLSSGSQGCTGSAANSLTNAFTICINLAQNAKSGNSWQKSYSMTLTPVDDDLTNDSYSFAFTSSAVPGTINSLNNVWTIKLPACLNAGTSVVSRTFYLQLSDGRGGTVTREIIVKFQSAAAASSCM